MVEHHLAKVRVASSNLVVRSERVTIPILRWVGRVGEGTDCKSVYTGSNPVPTSTITTRISTGDWRSLVARFPDTEEVTGSSPVSPTNEKPLGNRGFHRSGETGSSSVSRTDPHQKPLDVS